MITAPIDLTGCYAEFERHRSQCRDCPPGVLCPEGARLLQEAVDNAARRIQADEEKA